MDKGVFMSTSGKRKSNPNASTQIEALEGRCLLSVSAITSLDSIVVSPTSHRTSAMAAAASAIQGYTPRQIRAAYGFNQISLPGGVKADGTGQTIAIITAFNDPNITSDLHTFDSALGLSDPKKFSIVNQTGGSAKSLTTDSGWAGETALDVEWAHAIAPGANILLVEANSNRLSDLLTAVDYARHAAGVSVVSMSWGADEFWSQTYYDKYFTTPARHQGVTFVASSGDDGSWWGPSWPSSSSNVLAVGGTSLRLTSTNSIGSETGWSGSGGGISQLEYEPSYQNNVQRSGARVAPDVSYNANPNTGFAFYDSVADSYGDVGWGVVGGTSAGTPQWAALVAIANQGRALAGKGSLDGATGTLPTLYALYNNPSAYTAAFNDVTLGRSSYFFSAHRGYDAVTGLGTPKAPGVVQALMGIKPTATTSSTATATASRSARQQLQRRATPVEQTPTSDNSTTTTPVAVVPPAVETVQIKRSAPEVLSVSLGSTGTAASAAGAGSGGTGSRPGVFSTRRVALASAGYERPVASRTAVVWQDGGVASTPGASAGAFAQAGPGPTWGVGPSIIEGIVPIEPGATTLPDTGSLADIFAGDVLNNGIVGGITILNDPPSHVGSIATTVAALGAVGILTYGLARRRRRVPDVDQEHGEPIRFDLRQGDREKE
jgi:hypothetical protein